MPSPLGTPIPRIFLLHRASHATNGRLLPSTATQHRTGCLFACLLQFKKNCGNRQRPTDSADNSNGFRASSLFALPSCVERGGRVGGDGVVDNSREREISAKLAFGRPQNTSAKRTSPPLLPRFDPTTHSTLIGFHFPHIIVELLLFSKL